jgi:hypothetical protein
MDVQTSLCRDLAVFGVACRYEAADGTVTRLPPVWAYIIEVLRDFAVPPPSLVVHEEDGIPKVVPPRLWLTFVPDYAPTPDDQKWLVTANARLQTALCVGNW